jgi:hypothetical protein
VSARHEPLAVHAEELAAIAPRPRLIDAEAFRELGGGYAVGLHLG